MEQSKPIENKGNGVIQKTKKESSNSTSQIVDDAIFGQVINIPIVQIDFEEISYRGNQQDRSIKKMAKSIDKVGVLQPIRVRQENNRYKIVFGHRRYAACKLKGHKTIPALVLPENSRPQDEHLMRIIENLNRKNFQPIQLANEIHDHLKSLHPDLDLMSMINLFNNYDRQSKLHNEHESPVTSLLDIIGCSTSTIKNYLNLLRLPSKFKKAIKENRLKATLGYVLANNMKHVDFDAICEKALDNKNMSKRALEKLFKSHEEIQEGMDQVGVQARNFLQQLRELKSELKEKSDHISYDDADMLMQELAQLRQVIEEFKPISRVTAS